LTGCNRIGKAPPMPNLSLPPALNTLIAEQPLALFLDFDGTLVELAPSPDEIHLTDALSPMLAEVSRRLDGRLAIVSGRSVEWLQEAGLGGHILSGTHGSEAWWPGDEVERTARPPQLDEIDAAFQLFASERPGVIVERKTLAAGLHFRMAPDQGEAAHAFAARLSQQSGLAVQPGKMMVELRLPGGSKGTAVEALMQREPFRGGVPVFIGDDVTDEDGFRAATTHGGFGIAVGERDSENARYHLPTVSEVHEWLRL
jgi:trehalose 6-phosphate phosphatase